MAQVSLWPSQLMAQPACGISPSPFLARSWAVPGCPWPGKLAKQSVPGRTREIQPCPNINTRLTSTAKGQLIVIPRHEGEAGPRAGTGERPASTGWVWPGDVAGDMVETHVAPHQAPGTHEKHTRVRGILSTPGCQNCLHSCSHRHGSKRWQTAAIGASTPSMDCENEETGSERP